MGFDADDNEHDYEFSCPRCGSNQVVVEDENGFYYISKCHKCGYRRNQQTTPQN